MRQFRALIVLGVVLVILLVIIDTIDAGRKENKRKETEARNENGNGKLKNEKLVKLRKSENSKLEKSKKLNDYKTSNTDQLKKEYKIETNKNIEKNRIKSGKKEGKENKEEIPKITKTYQKVKKYKIVEDLPAQKLNSNKKTHKKNKSHPSYKEEVVDEVLKSLKKTSQKKNPKEINNINVAFNGEINKLNEEETIFVEEGNSDDKEKKKKYKLVEVVLEDEEEAQEGNETIGEGLEYEDNQIQRTESEEVIEKIKTTQTLKFPKAKKGSNYDFQKNEENGEEESIDEENFYESQDDTSEQFTSNDEDGYSSSYEDPHNTNTLKKCKSVAEDPNRQGPKKLTLYVIEEEVDGQKNKRVVLEEDGATMCEVADLLQRHYYDVLQ